MTNVMLIFLANKIVNLQLMKFTIDEIYNS